MSGGLRHCGGLDGDYILLRPRGNCQYRAEAFSLVLVALGSQIKSRAERVIACHNLALRNYPRYATTAAK